MEVGPGQYRGIMEINADNSSTIIDFMDRVHEVRYATEKSNNFLVLKAVPSIFGELTKMKWQVVLRS